MLHIIEWVCCHLLDRVCQQIVLSPLRPDTDASLHEVLASCRRCDAEFVWPARFCSAFASGHVRPVARCECQFTLSGIQSFAKMCFQPLNPDTGSPLHKRM